jgi:hypothetical protein
VAVTYEIEDEQVEQPVEEPTPTPAPAAAEPEPAPAADPEPQTEVEFLRSELARYREESRHARSAPAPAPTPAAPPADDLPEDAAGFTDLLTSKGPGVLKQYIKKWGYVAGDEVERIATTRANEIVEAKTRTVTAESRIDREFPELANTASPLYQRTSQILQEMVGMDANAAKSPASLYAAAKAAKAEITAAKPAPVAPPTSTRTERIAAQSAPRSHDIEDDGAMGEVDLTPAQQRMARMMKVPENEYAAQLKATSGRRR